MISRSTAKYILFTFLLFVVFSSCKSESNHQDFVIEPPAPEETEQADLRYKTITIDYDSINQVKEEYNRQFAKLNTQESIEALKQICKLPGIKIIVNDSLPFQDYENLSDYYANNIPLPIYQKMFPKEEIKFDKRRITNPIVDEKAKTITIQKGVRIREERKYKTLLSLIEKEAYVQMLVTTQGKYSPDIELLTFDKQDFGLIDQISLKGGIYDSYDIDYWHARISDDYNQVEITKVKNLEQVDIRLDTTVRVYELGVDGTLREM